MRSAWPINLPVLDLRSECTSAYSAAHLFWEVAWICNPLDFTPGSKSLNPLKYFQVYNCIVTVLYEVHFSFPLIPFLLGGKCVCTISLLQQCITSVSFILQNIFNQFPSPWSVPWALCIQFSCNGTWCFSVEIFREYSLDYAGFLRYDRQFMIFQAISIWCEACIKFAIHHSHLDPKPHIAWGTLTFALGDRGEYSRYHLAW